MRKEKQLLLDEIQQKIESSSALFVTKYDKLEPNSSWEFRELLSKSKSQFEVVKKRVFLKAAKNSGIEIDETLLDGHIGIVFVEQEDAMAPAKTLFKFSDDNGDLFKVLCGRIEGKIVPGSDVEVLSKLPTLDEMRATLIGLLTAPMSQLLSVMEAAIAGPISVIKQKSEQ